MTDYLVIRNWDNFQHYKTRNPPWIKNYTELLSDDAYLSLTGHRRAILHGLWLEYARSRSRLALDTLSITRRLSLRVTTADLKALANAGFIDIFASTSLAPRKQSAIPEEEEYREETYTQDQSVTQNGSPLPDDDPHDHRWASDLDIPDLGEAIAAATKGLTD